MDDRLRISRPISGWQQFLGGVLPGLSKAIGGATQPELPQPGPFDNLQMLDTAAPPMQMSGGNNAAVLQALQMLAQMMAQRQAPNDPTAGMYGGSGPGY